MNSSGIVSSAIQSISEEFRPDVGDRGGTTPWVVFAKPAHLEISRKTLLDTALGAWLRKHNAMWPAVIVCLLTVSISVLGTYGFVPSFFHQQVPIEREIITHCNVDKVAIFRRPFSSNLVSTFFTAFGIFLVCHFCNTDILVKTLSHLDTKIIVVSWVIASSAMVFNCISLIGDDYDGLWMVGDIMFYIAAAVFFVVCGSIDAFRLPKAMKSIILLVIAFVLWFVYYMFSQHSKDFARHATCNWGIPCRSVRNTNLSSLQNIAIFVSKAGIHSLNLNKDFIAFHPNYKSEKANQKDPEGSANGLENPNMQVEPAEMVGIRLELGEEGWQEPTSKHDSQESEHHGQKSNSSEVHVEILMAQLKELGDDNIKLKSRVAELALQVSLLSSRPEKVDVGIQSEGLEETKARQPHFPTRVEQPEHQGQESLFVHDLHRSKDLSSHRANGLELVKQHERLEFGQANTFALQQSVQHNEVMSAGSIEARQLHSKNLQLASELLLAHNKIEKLTVTVKHLESVLEYWQESSKSTMKRFDSKSSHSSHSNVTVRRNRLDLQI